MSFNEKGHVRIDYEEAGSGFPLLLIAAGDRTRRSPLIEAGPLIRSPSSRKRTAASSWTFATPTAAGSRAAGDRPQWDAYPMTMSV